MPTPQTSDQINEMLTSQVVGRAIRRLQVLSPNALKTVHPDLTSIIDTTVTRASCVDRVVEIQTADCTLRIDLERTGRVATLQTTDAWAAGNRTAPPTLRLLLADDSALDFAEPAKTKRITVSLLPRTD